MSRKNEYQFVPTDPEEIVTWMVALYEAITGETVQPASAERVFIQYLAAVIIQERVQNNYTGNQNIPSRASGENLDALAELTASKSRPEATKATCTMRFCISEPQASAVLIPKGTRITDASKTLIWETPEDCCIPIGQTSVEIGGVRCMTAGTSGNGYTPGQLNKLVDVYDYFSSCENITTSAGGSDEPDDDEYYELMRASMDAFSTAGARGAYEYWAKQTNTQIADVLAVTPEPCVVKLYVLMKDGTIATQEVKNAVLEELGADERRPLGDRVSVEDAEIVRYSVRMTYYQNRPLGDGQTSASIEAAVQEAVGRYTEWQSEKMGRDINPSKLVGMLMQTGVKRVELTEPVFTHLRDGGDGSVPQTAVLDRVDIVNGGFEDE